MKIKGFQKKLPSWVLTLSHVNKSEAEDWRIKKEWLEICGQHNPLPARNKDIYISALTTSEEIVNIQDITCFAKKDSWKTLENDKFLSLDNFWFTCIHIILSKPDAFASEVRADYASIGYMCGIMGQCMPNVQDASVQSPAVSYQILYKW